MGALHFHCIHDFFIWVLSGNVSDSTCSIPTVMRNENSNLMDENIFCPLEWYVDKFQNVTVLRPFQKKYETASNTYPIILRLVIRVRAHSHLRISEIGLAKMKLVCSRALRKTVKTFFKKNCQEAVKKIKSKEE